MYYKLEKNKFSVVNHKENGSDQKWILVALSTIFQKRSKLSEIALLG
jgi:hypothetical protein